MPFVHDHVDGVGTDVGHAREAIGDVRLHRCTDGAGVRAPLEREVELDAHSRVVAHDSVAKLRDLLALPSLEQVFRRVVAATDVDQVARDIVGVMRL